MPPTAPLIIIINSENKDNLNTRSSRATLASRTTRKAPKKEFRLSVENSCLEIKANVDMPTSTTARTTIVTSYTCHHLDSPKINSRKPKLCTCQKISKRKMRAKTPSKTCQPGHVGCKSKLKPIVMAFKTMMTPKAMSVTSPIFNARSPVQACETKALSNGAFLLLWTPPSCAARMMFISLVDGFVVWFELPESTPVIARSRPDTARAKLRPLLSKADTGDADWFCAHSVCTTCVSGTSSSFGELSKNFASNWSCTAWDECTSASRGIKSELPVPIPIEPFNTIFLAPMSSCTWALDAASTSRLEPRDTRVLSVCTSSASASFPADKRTRVVQVATSASAAASAPFLPDQDSRGLPGRSSSPAVETSTAAPFLPDQETRGLPGRTSSSAAVETSTATPFLLDEDTRGLPGRTSSSAAVELSSKANLACQAGGEESAECGESSMTSVSLQLWLAFGDSLISPRIDSDGWRDIGTIGSQLSLRTSQPLLAHGGELSGEASGSPTSCGVANLKDGRFASGCADCVATACASTNFLRTSSNAASSAASNPMGGRPSEEYWARRMPRCDACWLGVIGPTPLAWPGLFAATFAA
mmetsp:Transcript_74326/g.215401  ORF Transcript_74326/g.215401 Transcript_74326/m.215401 type:complete len:588 (+) Transcript_74326:929-2692(+)